MYLGIELFLADFTPVHWLFFHKNEFWKDVKGYEGLYQISKHGRVKSFHKKNKPTFLTLFKTEDGYFITYLCKPNSKMWNISVHRLVALNFIPNLNNKPQINHIKGKSNYFRNLEWCTGKENIAHAIETGLRSATINLKNNSMFSLKDITDIRTLIRSGKSNQEICTLYKCNHSTISKIRRGVNYSDSNNPPEDIWSELGKKNKIIFDPETGIFYENLKIAAKAKNIPHQVLRYQILYAVNKTTLLKFI